TPVDGPLARALCDRRTGVGADGLLWAGPGTAGADVTMTLHNADGSRAEMSGNGIRCLAQAVARSRGSQSLDLDVATDAGLRRVEVRPGSDDRTVQVRVDMGAITEAAAPELGLGAKDVVGASVGNPHVVALYPDRAALDAAADGFAMTDRNVEFVVAGPSDDELTLRVVERGVGETQACGTGACAAAWAGHRWGLVGERVTVHMPGGSAQVELGTTVFLTGPAVFVADVTA
ncbi:MAG: dapF, partial [Actinomycetia bacterium]|nr:dapF [Actinomycetes bacterium]